MVDDTSPREEARAREEEGGGERGGGGTFITIKTKPPKVPAVIESRVDR